MGNPFKKIVTNSKETAKKWEDARSVSGTESRKCPQCGAPRQVNTNLSYCSYCRYQFMNVDVTIKHGHGK